MALRYSALRRALARIPTGSGALSGSGMPASERTPLQDPFSVTCGGTGATHLRRFSRRKSLITLGVVAVAMCSTALGQDEDMPDAVKQAGIALLERAVSAYNGRITLSGTVVDDSGNPLQGVRLRYSKSTAALDWTQMGGEGSTNEVVDRTFSIDVDNAGAITLHFSKAGYLPARLGFSTRDDLSPEEETAFFGPDPIHPPHVVREGLEVVLYEVGEAVELVESYARLTHRGDGSGVVLSGFGSSQGGPTEVSDVNDTALPEPDCIRMVAATNAQGEISVVQITNEVLGVSWRYPERFRLIMNDPEGGFVVFTPAPGVPVEVQMKTAPETGYTREVEFTAEQMANVGEGYRMAQDVVWFFLKSHGKFGKGNLGIAKGRTWNGHSMAFVGITLWVQPNGSRHVQTVEGHW